MDWHALRQRETCNKTKDKAASKTLLACKKIFSTHAMMSDETTGMEEHHPCMRGMCS
jgi:hypothetical protein